MTSKFFFGHRPSKHTIDFLEMPTPMGESLCLLVRLGVKEHLKIEEIIPFQYDFGIKSSPWFRKQLAYFS